MSESRILGWFVLVPIMLAMVFILGVMVVIAPWILKPVWVAFMFAGGVVVYLVVRALLEDGR